MKAAATCQDFAALLNDYAEKALDPRQHASVEAHLRGCPACREAVRQSLAVRGLFNGAFGPDLYDRHATDTSKRLREITTGGVAAVPFEEEEEPVAAPAPGFLDSLAERFGAAPWWIVSGAFHGLLILLLFLIGMALMQARKNETVIVTSLEKQKEPEPPKEPEREIFTQPVPVTMPEAETVEKPVVTHEEVEISDHEETDENMDNQDAFGDEGISDIPLGGSGISGAIGVGGGGAGAFGRPLGGGRQRLARAMAGGGGKPTESAVDKALEWLARHQEADGHWDVRKHEGKIDADGGVTGLALLAFLGAGHTEKVGKYKENVQRAVKWIISKQEANGYIGRGYSEGWDHAGHSPYHHAICGLALAEASAMGRVAETRAAAQKAIDYSTEIHQQQKDGSEKGAWRYKPNTDIPDASVSGWFVMQLKSAKVAGLAVNPASFEGALRYYDSIEVKEKYNGYEGGRFPYNVGASGKQGIMLNPTAIGILCNLFLGRQPADLMGGAEYLREQQPKWDAKLGQGNGGGWPMYYTYYGTLTMFQMGGDYWKEWNESLKAMLLPKQRKDGDFDGSWDPVGGTDDGFAGRVYMTAMGALCLEVYYRYLPIIR